MPPKSIFHEFFWLFESKEGALQEPAFERMLHLCGTYEKSCERMGRLERPFEGYEEFIADLDGRSCSA